LITNAPENAFSGQQPSGKCGVWQLPQPAIVSTNGRA
jgi:hypothetical protein